VDLNNQANNTTAQDSTVKELLDSGISWSEMWMTFGQKRYPYDKNFIAVSNYAMKNPIAQNDNDSEMTNQQMCSTRVRRCQPKKLDL
jgi:hypothetical protein